ncbi:uncharacterized protein LOC110978946 isoform X2 [Acanthaster planci]|uniref:Uncharacterized protein LOC110978946 isoform X2 n=1 Tax=Acanthaster planci TaxID=133434 RepID=A0A8B7Y9T2_ACAPL|nr:uncharacterized protein LOC110978946 isoform X2 [Acanthaster planci]
MVAQPAQLVLYNEGGADIPSSRLNQEEDSPIQLTVSQGPTTAPPSRHLPIIGPPSPRKLTGKYRQIPSIKVSPLRHRNTTMLSRKPLNNLVWGEILPDKPRLQQFKPPSEKDQQTGKLTRIPVQNLKEEHADFTPEDLADLSIEAILAITGISLGDEKPTQSATKEESDGCFVVRQVVVWADDSGGRQREKDSPVADSCLLSVTKETNPSKDLPHDHKDDGKVLDLIEDSLFGDELDEEGEDSTDRSPLEDPPITATNQPRFPPRLPPLRPKCDLEPNKSYGKKMTKRSKQKQRQNGDHGLLKGPFLKESDSKFESEESRLNSKGYNCQLSSNNNGSTEDLHRNRAGCTEVPKPSQGSLDSILQMMMTNLVPDDYTTEATVAKAANSFSVPPVSAPAVKVAQHATPTVSIPLGFGIDKLQDESKITLTGPQDFEAGVTNCPADLTMIETSYPPTGFFLKVRPSKVSTVPPPPGFLRQNVQSGSTQSEESNVEQTNGVDEKCQDGTAVSQNHHSSEDWYYKVPWPADWKEKNRDASHLPAGLRKALHIDLSWLQQDGDDKPKLKPGGSNMNTDDTKAIKGKMADKVQQMRNGNNNHILSNTEASKDTQCKRKPTWPNSSGTDLRNLTSISSSPTDLGRTTFLSIGSSDNPCSENRNQGSCYISNLSISTRSDSLLSQSSLTSWGLDVDELILLLSDDDSECTSDDFLSDDVTFVCENYGTVDHSQHHPKSLQSPLLSPDIVSPFCLTLANGEHDVFDLRQDSNNRRYDPRRYIEEDIFLKPPTESRDSLDRYLSEGTWTDHELEYIFKASVVKKTKFQLNHSRNAEITITGGIAEKRVPDNVTYRISVRSTEIDDAQLLVEDKNPNPRLDIAATDDTHSLEVQSQQRTDNSSLQPALDVEKWMRFHDAQMEQAIRMERLAGGRSVSAPQLVTSDNSYDRVIDWVRTSDFSLAPSRGKDEWG